MANIETAMQQNRALVLRRQRESFRALLRHVWGKSRFYRDLYTGAGIREHDLAALEPDDLPIIDKQLLMDHFDLATTDPRLRKSDLERWVTEVSDPAQNYLDEFVVCRSSGCSGVDGFSVCTIREWQLASTAMATRLDAPANYGTGKTKAAFYLLANGNFAGVSGAARMPQSIYDVRTLSILDSKETVIDRLNEFQPHQLHGYASSVHELSRLAVMGRLQISPKRIFISGDKLTEEMERQIHRAWAPHLIDSYSAAESRFIAFRQSGESAMNIIDELNILEILDSNNRQAGTGQSGRAVLTNLYNATLPLIRYDLGDYLVCGAPNIVSPIKTIKEISGRLVDALPVTSGNGGEDAIPPLVLASFYVFIPRLEKIQFVSLAKDRVRINYVSGENLDGSIQSEFQRLLDRAGAARTTFEVYRAPEIDPDPQTGKHTFVVVAHRSPSIAALEEMDRTATEGGAHEVLSSSTRAIADPQPTPQLEAKEDCYIPGLPADQENILRTCFHPLGSAVEFAEADVESSIPERLRKTVRLYGNRLALIAGEERLTYSQLDGAANRVAHALLAQRGPSGEPVALLLETGIKAIVALLGVLKAGKAYVPLEPSHPPARLSLMLADSQAVVVITERSMFDMVQATVARQTQLLDINEILAGAGDEEIECRAAPGDLAYIMYTSGSAGEPKGVVQDHRNILHKIFTHTHDYRICAHDRITLLYSYSFSASVRCIFGALLNGAALLIYDAKRQALADIAQRLIDDRASLYLSVPTLFREIAVALARIQTTCSIRLVYLASEAVSKPDLDLYKRSFPETCILVHELASSETGSVRQHFFCKTTEISGDIVPVGYAVRDMQVLLLDEHQRPVGPNRIGEIAVRSRFLSPGYWRRPDLTQAKFLADPGDPEMRTYLTADLGLMRPDGCLEYRGRKDFQVKVRGHNVDIGEIEATLTSLDGIKEAAVASRQKSDGETYLIAYVVPDRQLFPTAGALRSALADRLPGPTIPSSFFILDALPQTPNGKIDRKRLPEPGNVRPALDTAYIGPHTPVEKQVAAIWTKVLGLERIGLDDNFFDLGGHSLAAARILSRVRTAFHIDLPIKAFFDRPTVAEMVQAILAEQARCAESIDQLLSEIEEMADFDIKL